MQHLDFQGTSDLRILAQPAERSLGMHKPGMVVYTCLSQSIQAVNHPPTKESEQLPLSPVNLLDSPFIGNCVQLGVGGTLEKVSGIWNPPIASFSWQRVVGTLGSGTLGDG